jgi:hypothetical protein
MIDRVLAAANSKLLKFYEKLQWEDAEVRVRRDFSRTWGEIYICMITRFMSILCK